MKQCAIWIMTVMGVYVFQVSALPLISFHGVTADLLLLFMTSFAFLNGLPKSILMGFGVGLLQDLASGTFLGINMLMRMLLAILCGYFSKYVIKDKFSLPIIASPLVGILNYFLVGAVFWLLGYNFNFYCQVYESLLPMVIYQVVFAYPIHMLVYGLYLSSNDKKTSSEILTVKK